MTIGVPTGRVEFGPLLEVLRLVRTILRRVSSPNGRAVLYVNCAKGESEKAKQSGVTNAGDMRVLRI